MTKEQIAKLRRGAEIIAKEWTSAPPSMDSPWLLLRALDEREALLEALRHVDFVLKEDSYRGTYVGPYIAKAIARAEAP